MTEGSLYEPFCDFEKYGLDYDYISNSYLQECKNDIRKMLNRVFKIHCNFEEDDIVNLSDRDFSIYFWSQYLMKLDADIRGVKKLIDEGKFDSVACIPTKDYMKKPSEIYSLTISSYVNKHVVDWENKLPLADLPNIECDKEEKRTLFGLLLSKPSNTRLSFCDSLYALFSFVGKERRIQLLQWMIETYDEKYDVDVTEYRADESAKWKNTKNDDKPIAELYALSYNEKKLEQYFGNLPKIINKEYLPAGPISFKNACDILQIPTIEPKDLIVDKIGQVSKNEVYKKTLRIYALVLAGYEDAENWNSRYQKYSELIDALELWCCDAISIRYEKDENICQKLKKFYREKDSADFYFVKSLDDKIVFVPFVESFIEYLGIEADEDLVKTVMDSREAAIEKVKENNPLMLDDAFKEELDLLIPGIKRELNGNEADDTDFVDIDNRHIFTGYTGEYEGETSQEDNPEDNEFADNDVDDNEPKKICSDKGATHDYPTTIESGERKSSENVTRTRAGEGTSSYIDLNGREGSMNNYEEVNNGSIDSDTAAKSSESNNYKDTFTQKEQDDVIREYSEKVSEFMGGGFSMPEDGIKAKHIIARYRGLTYIKENATYLSFSSDFDEKEYIRSEKYSPIPLVNGKELHVQSVIYGIWYLSPSIWNAIVNQGNYACLCTGFGDHDFKMIMDKDDVKAIAESSNNVLMKMSPSNSMDIMSTIESVLNPDSILIGDNIRLDTIYTDRNVHLMLKVHQTPNSDLNSIFDEYFNSEGNMELD